MILCDKLNFSEHFCLVSKSLRQSHNDFLIKSGHILIFFLHIYLFIIIEKGHFYLKLITKDVNLIRD